MNHFWKKCYVHLLALSVFYQGRLWASWRDLDRGEGGVLGTFRLLTPPGARKYEVSVHHQPGEERIVIEAYLYAAHDTEEEQRQLHAAIAFWNQSTGKFALRVGSKKTPTLYPIHFHLREAPGYYNENQFFIPSVPQAISLEVLPADVMARLQKLGAHQEVAGYAPEDIYISAKYAEYLSIGIHETGHTLGARHDERSVMAKAFDLIKLKVKKRNIRDILHYAGVLAAKDAAHERKEGFRTQINHHGTIPEGFFKQGKVVRLEK